MLEILGSGSVGDPFNSLTQSEKAYYGLFSHNYFNSLPIETVQLIASFLDYDSDLCNFKYISQGARDAVDADNQSFWRRRFLQYFEASKDLSEDKAGMLVTMMVASMSEMLIFFR
jgi:hypothetical protein